MAQLAFRNKVFSDLDLDFDIHPNTKKLNSLTAENAVVRSLKNLLFTNHYERPFHPEIGCSIKRSLFENIGESTAITIQNQISEVIANFEPRVNLIAVNVFASPEKNGYVISLKFFIINEASARQINFFLKRVR